MTQAAYWHALCSPAAAGRPMVRSPWCRRMLTEAAKSAETTGFCALFFRFEDGSRLTISEQAEVVA